MAALRYWGIGFSIEDHAIAKQIDQGIARVVFGRLASDLGCIDKIERWLQRKGHQTSYVEILSDRVGRHYEQLMRDILNEEEMIARRAKLYEDFAEKTDLRVRLADVPRRHGAGVQVTKVLNRERVEQKLASDPETTLAWEPVPLDIYGALPAGIRSNWVFVLRANTTAGAERHPNSHQRVMSWRGSGDLQTWEGGWQSNVLVDRPGASLDARWLSIPVNVWHKPVMSTENWVVVSFHTALADELIEERGDPAAGTNLRQRTYL